jgi:hypothetical protein
MLTPDCVGIQILQYTVARTPQCADTLMLRHFIISKQSMLNSYKVHGVIYNQLAYSSRRYLSNIVCWSEQRHVKRSNYNYK